jgi:hypothetical protein
MDAAGTAVRMKRKLIIALWGVGSCGAVLFVCAILFGVIYTRRFNIGVAGILAIGIFAAWEGFKMYREEKRSTQL